MNIKDFLANCKKYVIGEPYINEEDFQIVNFVFEWYPCFNSGSIDRIANLYCIYGMPLIADMLPRAQYNKKLYDKLEELSEEMEKIRTQIEDNKRNYNLNA